LMRWGFSSAVPVPILDTSVVDPKLFFFGSGSGSDFPKSFGSGSGSCLIYKFRILADSDSVPDPQHCLTHVLLK
jgi:hypothetical protein